MGLPLQHTAGAPSPSWRAWTSFRPENVSGSFSEVIEIARWWLWVLNGHGQHRRKTHFCQPSQQGRLAAPNTNKHESLLVLKNKIVRRTNILKGQWGHYLSLPQMGCFYGLVSYYDLLTPRICLHSLWRLFSSKYIQCGSFLRHKNDFFLCPVTFSSKEIRPMYYLSSGWTDRRPKNTLVPLASACPCQEMGKPWRESKTSLHPSPPQPELTAARPWSQFSRSLYLLDFPWIWNIKPAKALNCF